MLDVEKKNSQNNEYIGGPGKGDETTDYSKQSP
ncbi:MAG: hypothetical protein BWY70_02007 [Bacteroidetes bacterium ADurb.Bin408]|nr:MAG: hypothetical protein BWY70_02007 [Bacteroidetes bacterium ADurb.Bin408]